MAAGAQRCVERNVEVEDSDTAYQPGSRSGDRAGKEMNVWKVLTDKGLKEGFIKESSGEQREIKIIRCYEPEARDVMVDLYISEPMIIDSRLEVINAVSDLIE